MWFRWYKGRMKVSYLNLETIVNFNYVTSMFPSYFILNLYVLVHSAPMMVIIIGPRAILSVIVLFSKCSILIRIGDFERRSNIQLGARANGAFFHCASNFYWSKFTQLLGNVLWCTWSLCRFLCVSPHDLI